MEVNQNKISREEIKAVHKHLDFLARSTFDKNLLISRMQTFISQPHYRERGAFLYLPPILARNLHFVFYNTDFKMLSMIETNAIQLGENPDQFSLEIEREDGKGIIITTTGFTELINSLEISEWK